MATTAIFASFQKSATTTRTSVSRSWQMAATPEENISASASTSLVTRVTRVPTGVRSK